MKSSTAPVLHADGVFGGATPSSSLYMAFFSEHAMIPDSMTYGVERVDAARLRLLAPEQPDQFAQVVREIGAEVIMTLEVARIFRQWLDEKISLLERAQPEDLLTQTEQQQL